MWTHTNTPEAKAFVKSLIPPDLLKELRRASIHDEANTPANLEVQLVALLGYYEHDYQRSTSHPSPYYPQRFPKPRPRNPPNLIPCIQLPYN